MDFQQQFSPSMKGKERKEKGQYYYEEQECIPVGCVTSAALAICPGGGCLPGGVCPNACWDTTPMNRMTDRCKNITLPQLRCGR